MTTWTTTADASGYANPTLAEIKTYLSIDASTYDDLLTDIKYAVFARIEKLTGQNFNNASGASFTVNYDSNQNYFEIPYLPVTSITSVIAYDTTDASAALTDGNGYKSIGLTGSRDGTFWLDIFNNYNEVRVVYVSNGSTLPYDIKLAVMGWIKKIWNDERDFVGGGLKTGNIAPPKETMSLIQPYIKVHA